MPNDKILKSANPLREAVSQFIATFKVAEWNQDTHASFVLWTGVQLGLLRKDDPASACFAKMLRSHGAAGNASQFGQNLCKPEGKHELGGLLTSRVKVTVDPLAGLL